MAKSDLKKSIKSKQPKKAKQGLLKNVKEQLKVSKKDLIDQVNVLSKEISDFKNKNSSKKIIKKLEKKYKKEKTNLQKEFNEQIEKLHAIQENLLSHLPKELTQTLNLKNSNNNKVVKTKPALSNKVAPTRSKNELAAIKGIGPVTLKKLQDAGITTLEDIANTPDNKVEALKSFENTKGFQSWEQQAKDVLSKK